MTPGILLDTNIWRRLVDADAVEQLRLYSRREGVDIVVAPAVAYEILRTRDAELRERLAKAITLGTWRRLMTEVFYECEDFRHVIRSRRPGWLRAEPDRAQFHRLRAGWSGGRFWRQVRANPASEAARLRALEGESVQLARAQATSRRGQMKTLQFDSTPLTDWVGRPELSTPGWDGRPVEWWRLEGSEIWWRWLLHETPAREWLEPWLNLGVIATDRTSWNPLWFREISAPELPREWVRSAVHFLQGVRKVTPGTPADAQIAVHMVDVELLLSGDTTFVDILNRVRRDAPVHLAEAQAVPHRADALKQVMVRWHELAGV